MKSFKEELEVLINNHSIENHCDIPDFLLADLIVSFIHTIGFTVKKTLDWHGCNSVCHPKKTCEHNKGLNEYCEPCGRIHSKDSK